MLVLIKLGAVIVTGSVAILSTLLDSAADVIAAFVTLIGVHHAAKPADRKHRFGHGKADALSALAHGVFIAAAGLMITADAGRRLLFNPEPVATPQIGLACHGRLLCDHRHLGAVSAPRCQASRIASNSG